MPSVRAGGGVAYRPGEAYRGGVRTARPPRRDQAHLVTEARPGRSADIAYRQRRYLIMMGIRVVCFVLAVVLYVNHAGWLTAIPAVGAIIIPYFAVVFANGGREPDGGRGFSAYDPKLPDRYVPPPTAASGGAPESGTPDESGVPSRNGPSGHENQR